MAARRKGYSSQPSKILERAFTQINMKVISQLPTPLGGFDGKDGYNINFSILGNTGKIYNVIFNLDTTSESLDGPVVSCTCPYYKTHDEVCKHIYVVYIKVFRVIPDVISSNPNISISQRALLVNLYKNYVAENITPPPASAGTASRNGVDDECPVCFEKLLETNFICHQCRNSIHTVCISEVKKYSNACPLCRAEIKENLAEMMSLLRI